MMSALIAVLAILFSVGTVHGDEPQQNVRRHRVTGQYVTRTHRITYQQPGQGANAVNPGLEADTFPGIKVNPGEQTYPVGQPGQPTYVTRVHRYTVPGGKRRAQGQTSEGPTSQDVYEEISGPSSQDVYEEISGTSSYQDIYEEISGPTSQDVYEEISVSPESGSSYDVSLRNGGNSFEGDFGVNRRRVCNRGLVDRTATKIRNTVNGGVSGLMEAISSLTDGGTALGPVGGAVNAVGHAAGHLIQGKLNEIDFAINDAACGLGNIANAAADIFKTGDVVGGVGTIGKELVGGIGNIGEDVLSQAAVGIGNAAKDLLGFLGG